MDKKPWITFDYAKEFMWWASSRHEDMSSFPKYEIPRAFSMIQECNMGGSYIRVVAYDISNKTYFDVYCIHPDVEWPFSLKLSEMKSGDIVRYDNKHHYRVIDRYQDNVYIKVLEWIMETK